MNEQTQALQRIEQPTMALDAVGRKAAIDDLLNKVALVQEVMTKVMHEGEHYGKIPGCGDKPALLKAGAEKLGMTFRIRPEFDIKERDMPNGHREFSILCRLSDGTQGVGSCSTMESKYRYRQGERKCPVCGKATIITGKKEYGGGFLCFAKKGGCGEKFQDNDERILSQQVGKVEHDNPADFYNTCLKMAKKRAHVDAIITATACSDIFTQDVEEMVQNMEVQSAPPAPAPAPEAPRPATAPSKPIMPRVMEPNTGTQTLCRVTVKMVTEKTGTKKDGTPWIAYFMLMNDGTADLEAATFSKTFAGIAKTLAESNELCEITIKPGKKAGTYELVNILPLEGTAPKQQDDIPMEFNKDGQPISETIP